MTVCFVSVGGKPDLSCYLFFDLRFLLCFLFLHSNESTLYLNRTSKQKSNLPSMLQTRRFKKENSYFCSFRSFVAMLYIFSHRKKNREVTCCVVLQALWFTGFLSGKSADDRVCPIHRQVGMQSPMLTAPGGLGYSQDCFVVWPGWWLPARQDQNQCLRCVP